MSSLIHPTAIIHPSAQIAEGVEVDAYTVVGADVVIGRDSRIGSHVVIDGPTRIGAENHIYSFASIGAAPQDKKFKGEATELLIGDRNVIRECCTLNRGTIQDKGKTIIGNDNWIMAYVHIAHDCTVGNNTIFANSATLAGHVEIQDWVILGGFTLVHQFCVIGEHAFTGMGSAIGKDVPPYAMVSGAPAVPHSINLEGLKRRGFNKDAMHRIKEAHRILYRQNLTTAEALTKLESTWGEHDDIQRLVAFCRQIQRGIIR